MAAAQDHKRVNDNDEGPNTGGMGAYAPPHFSMRLSGRRRKRTIIAPLIAGLKKEGIDYRGVLYIGLMVNKGEPSVLEFNCRFGDPETKVVLPLLETDLVEIMLKINAKQLDKIKVNWYNKSPRALFLRRADTREVSKRARKLKALKTPPLRLTQWFFTREPLQTGKRSSLPAEGCLW